MTWSCCNKSVAREQSTVKFAQAHSSSEAWEQIEKLFLLPTGYSLRNSIRNPPQRFFLRQADVYGCVWESYRAFFSTVDMALTRSCRLSHGP